MSNQHSISIISIAFLVITCVFLWKNVKEKNAKIAAQQIEIINNWDETIADYQLHSNITYRDIKTYKAFFDSLNTCFDILRQSLHHPQPNFTLENQAYLSEFILKRMPKIAHIKEEEIFQKLEVNAIVQVFEMTKIKSIKRLTKVLNPHFMTKCKFFQDFDIWEKVAVRSFSPGDTTAFYVRLLPNYALRSHQLEFIPDENMKIIEPYLAEIRYIVPQNTTNNLNHKISFRLFNWVERDTFTQEIFF